MYKSLVFGDEFLAQGLHLQSHQSESQFDCFSLLCCCAVCDCSSAFLLNFYLTFTLLFKVIIYNLIPTIFLVLSIKLI